MLKRFKTRLIIAGILAVIAGISTFSFLGALQGRVTVVVAATDLPAHTLLQSQHLKTSEINKSDKDAYFKDAVSDPAQLIGMVTRQAYKNGMPLLMNSASVLTDEERTMALNYNGTVDKAAFIPYDKRVTAIEVDETGAIVDHLKKGDYVDIIFTSSSENSGGTFSTMLLQHIQIYGIEKTESVAEGGMSSKKKKITLMATSDECVRIAAAKRNGTIDLILNPLEGDSKPVQPVHILDLAARPPMGKGDLIKYYVEMVREDKELSASTKEEVIRSLERETDVEAVKNMIAGVPISETQKNDLIAKLGYYQSTATANAQRDSSSIFTAVEKSRLNDADKEKILEILGSYDKDFYKAEKSYDIDGIIQEIAASQLREDQKQKLINALSKLK